MRNFFSFVIGIFFGGIAMLFAIAHHPKVRSMIVTETVDKLDRAIYNPMDRDINYPNGRIGYRVATRTNAEDVIDALQEILDEYGVVTEQDVRVLIGKTSQFKHAKYGWTSVHDVHALRHSFGHDPSYIISFPPAEALHGPIARRPVRNAG